MVEDPPKLIQPREHKASVSIWADLTVDHMDHVDDAITPDQIKAELANIFALDDYIDNLKTGIIVDLYYYTIQFARDNNFTKEQTSALFSIVKKTHEVCIETPFGNVEQCFNYFKELLLCHAVKRPPFSIDLFTAEEVKKITEYVINTYFRHFKMYKYALTSQVRLDLSMCYAGMPPSPTPTSVEEEQPEDATEGGEDEGTGEGDGDAEKKELTETEQEVPQEDGDQTNEAEEAKSKAAASELRQLIRQELAEEIKKLKTSLDDQIKDSEENMNTKISSMEGGQKSGRGSAKGKKK